MSIYIGSTGTLGTEKKSNDLCSVVDREQNREICMSSSSYVLNAIESGYTIIYILFQARQYIYFVFVITRAIAILSKKYKLKELTNINEL